MLETTKVSKVLPGTIGKNKKNTANNRVVHQQKLRTKTTFRRQDPTTALAISRDHPCKIAGT